MGTFVVVAVAGLFVAVGIRITGEVRTFLGKTRGEAEDNLRSSGGEWEEEKPD